jgi:hypothetical protein
MRSQIIPLLKYEFMRFAWLIPLVYAFLILGIYRHENDQTKYMFRLNASGQETNIVMIMWFSFSAFFFSVGRTTSQGSAGRANFGAHNLDFFFSRAVDRRVWFAIKTALFVSVALLAPLLLGASHHESDPIRIELPYNSISSRATTTDFYLANFNGAHLEKPDTGHNEDYIVVPNGRRDMTHFQIVSNLLTLISFQILAFLFWPRGWGLGAAFVGSFAAIFFLSFPSMHGMSRYEEGVAFVANCPWMTAGALILFYLVSQLYCGWRFVHTEFTS